MRENEIASIRTGIPSHVRRSSNEREREEEKDRAEGPLSLSLSGENC